MDLRRQCGEQEFEIRRLDEAREARTVEADNAKARLRDVSAAGSTHKQQLAAARLELACVHAELDAAKVDCDRCAQERDMALVRASHQSRTCACVIAGPRFADRLAQTSPFAFSQRSKFCASL